MATTFLSLKFRPITLHLYYSTLNKITPGISPLKIRETKRVIKNIVDTSISSKEAESIIVGIDDLSNIDLSSKPLAVAIGYRESILSKFGYGLFDDVLIFEDILYNNQNFNADSMCLDRFKSISTTRLLPVFKYVRKSTITLAEDSHLSIYITLHDSVEKIIPNTIVKQIKNLPVYANYENLLSEIDAKPTVYKKAGILLKNIENLELSQIRDCCKRIFEFDKDSIKGSSHFKRCVMYLDLKENHI